MRIVLGSKSEDKLKILIDCLNSLNIKYDEILGQSVSSDIPEQPTSKEETAIGSLNRSRNAFNTIDEKEELIAIGLEGGLTKKDNIYNLICTATIYDGLDIITDSSDPVPLPPYVSKCIENGEEFGIIIREYSKTCDSDKYKCENIEELISRKKSFSQAIHKCLASKYN
ncbi:MAG: DUF84 family protein [Candidatus Saccharibacteria bacterium]